MVADVLPFTELLVEASESSITTTVEEPVELLRIDPVRPLDFAVEPRRLGLDVFVSHALVEHVLVEAA